MRDVSECGLVCNAGIAEVGIVRSSEVKPKRHQGARKRQYCASPTEKFRPVRPPRPEKAR